MRYLMWAARGAKLLRVGGVCEAAGPRNKRWRKSRTNHSKLGKEVQKTERKNETRLTSHIKSHSLQQNKEKGLKIRTEFGYQDSIRVSSSKCHTEDKQHWSKWVTHFPCSDMPDLQRWQWEDRQPRDSWTPTSMQQCERDCRVHGQVRGLRVLKGLSAAVSVASEYPPLGIPYFLVSPHFSFSCRTGEGSAAKHTVQPCL